MAALWSLYPGGSARVSSYKDMTSRDVASLTAVLSHAPPSHLPELSAQCCSYRSITRQEISNLPEHLLSRSSKGENFKASIPRSREGKLCDLHEPLNEALIASLFQFVRRQLEDKIPAAMNSVKCERRTSFQGTFGARLAPLNEVPSLWLSAPVFSERYGSSPGRRFTYQANGCIACMLARIGSDADVLVALLAAMKMHMSEERTSISGNSVRIAWVQQWIRQFPRRQRDNMLHVSDQMGGKLKSLHREARSENRRQKFGEATNESQNKSDKSKKSSGPSEGGRNLVQGWLKELVDSGYEDSQELTSPSSVYSDDTTRATVSDFVNQYRVD